MRSLVAGAVVAISFAACVASLPDHPETPASPAVMRSPPVGLHSVPSRLYRVLGSQGLLGSQGAVVPPWFNTETYDKIDESRFYSARETPLSTFSIDVDTASYANVRRFLQQGQVPPPDAVRIEELLNYFPYRYPDPEGAAPFSVGVELADCPWQPEHRLVRIALKGREIPEADRPPVNLVFLVDVSGSMHTRAKLPLVKTGLRLLASRLRPEDRVSLVVYAGAAGLVLPPTSGAERGRILGALEALAAGGSTNGGEGIRLAYRIAGESRIPGGLSRVILATDGDFNVGVTSQGELIRLLEENARRGISLTVLGFGMGNYKDSTLEKLADRADGNYAYIDTAHEARKVLVEQVGGTLITIAKDVKVQVEFNPLLVSQYRLIGYENRRLEAEDFDDDKKDAGEIGAGHTVTALYEIVPAGEEAESRARDLRYQGRRELSEAGRDGELLTVMLRYKEPEGGPSRLLAVPVLDHGRTLAQASEDFRFASAVAAFGMLLRESEHRGEASFEQVLELARSGRGDDPEGYRAEFVRLVELARDLRS